MFNEIALLFLEKKMNNVKTIIARIENDDLSVEQMLALCARVTEYWSAEKQLQRVASAFVSRWKRDKPNATNRELIEAIHHRTATLVQAAIVNEVAHEWSREDLDHACKVLKCTTEIFFAAGASGKYNDHEINVFCRALNPDKRMFFWETLLMKGALSPEMSRMVAMFDTTKKSVVIDIINQGQLTAEHLESICRKHKDSKDVLNAITSTGILPQKQVEDIVQSEKAFDDRNSMPF